MSCFLKKGDENEKVKKLQTKLKEKGYYTGSNATIDSYFGPITEKAVRNYQKDNNLDVDGCVGNQTWGSLFPTTSGSDKEKSKNYLSDKDPVLKQFSVAVKGKFNSITGFYKLVKANEKYDFEVGDTKDLNEEIKALVTNEGLNCVNYAQVAGEIMKRLNQLLPDDKQYKYRFVRTYCVSHKVGHHYIEASGNELKSKIDIDLAAAADSNYPMGKAWCQDYPKKEYNWPTVQKNDGIN